MRFIFYIVSTCLLLVSCGKKVDYTVLRARAYEHGRGVGAVVSLSHKPTKEEWKLLREAFQDEWSNAKTINVHLCVPSAYKGWGESPWAYYSCDKVNEAKYESVNFLGTPSKKQEDSLKHITPIAGKLKGRWYLYEPTNERVIFMVEKDSGLFLDVHAYTSGGEVGIRPLIPTVNNRKKFTDSLEKTVTYRLESGGDFIWNRGGSTDYKATKF